MAIYLDNAAATPVDPTVLAAMMPFLTTEFYNPSATYSGGRIARVALEDARTKVARCIGAKASEIIFTAGGTEANNIAIHGIMRRFPDAEILVSAVEHSAVLKPAADYQVAYMPVKADGRIDIFAVEASITDKTVLISCMYANNEIGTVQPLRALTKICDIIRKQRRQAGNELPLLLHVDACQAPNYLDIQVARLGADLVSFNGSKIYGPKQSGALFVRGGIVLQPIIQGGGQERGLRSGTENLAGNVGFAAALELAVSSRHAETTRLQALQQHWYRRIAQELPSVIINGSKAQRLPNNIHITVPGADNERLLFALDDAGIMAAAGSACSASSQTPSTVLAAIGLDEASAQASLRFTMGRDTTQAMINETIDQLISLIGY